MGHGCSGNRDLRIVRCLDVQAASPGVAAGRREVSCLLEPSAMQLPALQDTNSMTAETLHKNEVQITCLAGRRAQRCSMNLNL